jgi:hypothetical protein
MKKLVKTILKSVAVLILVLIIAIVVVFNLYADKALKWGVEKGGTSALKVSVGLGKASLSLLGGSLGLQDFAIANPPGYNNKLFLDLKNASFKVKISSLLSNVIEIPEIKLDGVNVVLEQKDILRNNIQEIINNISSGEKAPTPAEKTQQASGKKLHVNNLEITGVKVQVKLLPLPGRLDTIPLALPPIRMKDLGNDGTMTTGQLLRKIVAAISQSITENGTKILPADILNPMKDSLKGLGQLSGAILEQGKNLGDGLKDAGKGVGEKVKGLGDSLKGIITPKKE